MLLSVEPEAAKPSSGGGEHNGTEAAVDARARAYMVEFHWVAFFEVSLP